MVQLHVLQLLRELRLLLHVTGFFFTTPIPHLLPNIINMVLRERIIVLEQVHGLLPGGVPGLLLLALAPDLLAAFVRILHLGSSNVVALARQPGLIN